MAQRRLSMRKIEEILRLKYELKLTHRQIAQSCDISPSTVSEYITHARAAGIRWPLPEGMGEDELQALLFPERQRATSTIPQPDWVEVHKEKQRQSVTLSLLWTEYRQDHPDGYSYSQFCHHYRQWRKTLNPVMRQSHRAGEKLFIDYAGQTVPVIDPETGEISEVQIFVATLGASNYTYAEAHLNQTLPNWIGAHVRALDFFGGVPEVLVPDNLKAGVKSPHLYEPDINPTYQEFARHYGLAVVPARSRKPKDKAKVEVGVQVVERWILARLRDRTFFSLAELNQAIRELLVVLNEKEMVAFEQSRQALFIELDQPALRPLPDHRYQFARWQKARVGRDYHIRFDKHYYSVPYQLIGREVMVRATDKTIEVYYQRERHASHLRQSKPGRYTTEPEHRPPAHQAVANCTPETLLAEAEGIGPQTVQLVTAILDSPQHPQQLYRRCQGILRLQKRYGPDRLEAACGRALPAGIRTYRGLHNILKNKLDQLVQDEAPDVRLPTHQHIRGENYYH